MLTNRSLKIYILFAVISMGVITVLSFSTLAANNFVQGLDASVRTTMEKIGKNIDESGEHPRQILDFSIANSWEELPALVQRKLLPLDKHQMFVKQAERDHWWDRPTNVTFVLRYDLKNKQTIYISKVFYAPETSKTLERAGDSHITKNVLYAVMGIILFTSIILLLLHKISKPMKRLSSWAASLTPEVLQQPVPDFYYCELNNLANIVKSSLQSVQTTLDREKQFLSHASHELRTPIAVVRSNTELMQKLIEKQNSVDKQQAVLDRILRAGHSMTELCETLLWLNRGEYRNLPTTNVELSLQLEQLTNNLHYLIRDKDVEVHTHFESGEFPMKSTLVTIVLGNLIRNAYQHTQCGTVDIEQHGQKVTITNREAETQDDYNTLGFGLGLELTERIIRHYRWTYDVVSLPNGRSVTIEFSEKTKL
ncbi:histidine kinase dimerization/phospho-acceptor domain-containing protein [Vibrio sp. RC27]